MSFFEEFPQNDSVTILTQTGIKTKMYVATDSLEEYYHWRDEFIATDLVDEVVWWPTIAMQDGYWFSPFAKRSAMQSFFEQVQQRSEGEPISIMLDFEYPKDRSMIWSNLGEADANKAMIADFIETSDQHNITLYAIETVHQPIWFLRLVGLSYESEKITPIRMYYSSYRRTFLPHFIVDYLFTKEVKRIVKEDKILAIGLIALGVGERDVVYEPEVLKKEINIAKEIGVKEVIIFRLGGMSEVEYQNALH